MNQKLYYKDAYIQQFTTTVIKNGEDEQGTFVVLEETAFYPTGGGQPHDTGTIQGIPVTNVEEIDGEIRHYVTERVTGIVTGTIDWQRRFDHMQQHTGQHILSAAFAEKYDIATLAFHLGQERATIDLAIAELPEEMERGAEQCANAIVFGNHPISIRWVTKEEAETMPLRKETSVTENIRIVIIENFDYNGCGGTHPHHTGEVGPIKIVGWERHKGHIRLTFVCGWRALRSMHEKQSVLKQAVRLLHSKESDLPHKLEQILTSQKQTEKMLRDAQDQLLSYEAKELATTAKSLSSGKLVGAVVQKSMQDVVKLANTLTQDPEMVVCLVTKIDDTIQCICTRGKDVDYNMKDVLQNVLPLIEGKGGGSPLSARGGGKALISAEEMLQALVAHIQ